MTQSFEEAFEQWFPVGQTYEAVYGGPFEEGKPRDSVLDYVWGYGTTGSFNRRHMEFRKWSKVPHTALQSGPKEVLDFAERMSAAMSVQIAQSSEYRDYLLDRLVVTPDTRPGDVRVIDMLGPYRDAVYAFALLIPRAYYTSHPVASIVTVERLRALYRYAISLPYRSAVRNHVLYLYHEQLISLTEEDASAYSQ